MSMSPGLEDTPQARLLAEQIARQIQLDIISGHFDPTLSRYRDAEDRLSLGDLLDRFIALKERSRDPRTLEKYVALAKHIRNFGQGDRLISDVNQRVAETISRKLALTLAPRTVKEHMVNLAAAWDWGVPAATSNPFREIAEEIRLAPIQPLKPFSKQEIQKILAVLRSHPRWHIYHDFVAFLVCTGCRTGEAVALRWVHFSDDFRTAWIGESWDSKTRKPTKTRRSRDVSIVDGLRSLLVARSANREHPDLVFPSAAGTYIDARNFRKRVWVPLLRQAGVPYRKPYNLRRTSVSHALAAGNSPVDVAAQVGNHPRVLYENYAGAIAKPKMVDFVEDEDLQGELKKFI